jgi:site-specific DNA recombinase
MPLTLHRWLKEPVDDAGITVESIAERERCSIRKVNMTISLAFLAPDLVKAALEGRLPQDIGITRLRDAPTEWSRQHQVLGLSARASTRMVRVPRFDRRPIAVQ